MANTSHDRPSILKLELIELEWYLQVISRGQKNVTKEEITVKLMLGGPLGMTENWVGGIEN